MASTKNQPISLSRRFGGILYDTLIAGSVVFIIAAITLLILQLNGMGEVKSNTTLSNMLFLYYLFIAYVFFTWFWMHGGQTVGMKAWKIRVENMQGRPINIIEATARFGFALLLPVVSQLWSLFDKDKMALHDRLSRTRLTYIG